MPPTNPPEVLVGNPLFAAGVHSWNTSSGGDGVSYFPGGSVCYSGAYQPAVARAIVITATASGSQSVSLAWNLVGGASGYVVHYGDESGESQDVEQTPNNWITIEGLLPGTEYYFRVMAFDAVGSLSQESNEEKETPLP